MAHSIAGLRSAWDGSGGHVPLPSPGQCWTFPVPSGTLINAAEFIGVGLTSCRVLFSIVVRTRRG